MKPARIEASLSYAMIPYLRSLVNAALISGSVLLFSVHILAPLFTPIVGPPDFSTTKSLSLPAAAKLRLVQTDGRIRVYTHSDPAVSSIAIEASLKVYLNPGADASGIRDFANSLVASKGDSSELAIQTEPAERPESVNTVLVDYVIHVPAGTDIDLTGSNGNVWIAQGCGDVSVRGNNTDIEIVNPGGIVLANTVNGRIRLVEGRDDAVLDTENGNIYAHMLNGTLDARTTNGFIVARILDPAVKAFDLYSDNGGITVVAGDDASFSFKAKTNRGLIRSSFPVDGKTGILEGKELEGIVGDGRVQLNLTTLNGNIWLART